MQDLGDGGGEGVPGFAAGGPELDAADDAVAVNGVIAGDAGAAAGAGHDRGRREASWSWQSGQYTATAEDAVRTSLQRHAAENRTDVAIAHVLTVPAPVHHPCPDRRGGLAASGWYRTRGAQTLRSGPCGTTRLPVRVTCQSPDARPVLRRRL